MEERTTVVRETTSQAPADKHLVIIVILTVLFLGSLTFSFIVITGGEPAEKILLSEREERIRQLLEQQERQRQEQENELEISGRGEHDESEALTQWPIEKKRLEEEKAKLEQEKRSLQEKESALEKQLFEEIKGRPVFNVDKESPFDHVKDSQVWVFPSRVEIDLEDVTWWTIKDTHSMDPLLDIGATALSIPPRSTASLHVGDVALYDSLLAKMVIIHRIIAVDTDRQGRYSHFKGDNLKEPDPERVRFPQIKGVLIGIIY